MTTTTPMTPADLARLRGLVAEATPGPWTRGDDGGDTIWGAEWKGHKVHVGGVPFAPGDKRVNADAALICAAVNALPSLLAELEAAREDAAHLHEQLAVTLQAWSEEKARAERAEAHIAARLGGGEVVAASEVFRIAGGDVEVNTNPTAADALECLRDLRACYDEAIAPQPAAVSEAEVEAAAIGFRVSWYGGVCGETPWDDLALVHKAEWLKHARAALTAARAAKGEGEG